MEIYILRHGDADWPEWQGPDDERPLTKKGKKQNKRVGKFLANLNLGPLVILTSPLPRALQSAEIVADRLGLEARTEQALAPGLDLDRFSALVREHEGENILLVGHEPSLGQMIEATTGARCVLPKAGLARIDIQDAGDPHGELIWLIPPKLAAS